MHRDRVSERDTSEYYNRLRIANNNGNILVIYMFMSWLRILSELLKSESRVALFERNFNIIINKQTLNQSVLLSLLSNRITTIIFCKTERFVFNQRVQSVKTNLKVSNKMFKDDEFKIKFQLKDISQFYRWMMEMTIALSKCKLPP